MQNQVTNGVANTDGTVNLNGATGTGNMVMRTVTLQNGQTMQVLTSQDGTNYAVNDTTQTLQNGVLTGGATGQTVVTTQGANTNQNQGGTFVVTGVNGNTGGTTGTGTVVYTVD